MRAVIVGGGITGLTAAYRLRQHAEAAGVDLEVVVLEQAERVGGKLHTERVGGFTIEHGPDIFLARKPHGVALCEELGIADELQGTNPAFKGSYIQRHGKLHPLPPGFSGLLPASAWGVMRTKLLSPMGKLRLALEPFMPRRTEASDEPLGAFLKRRFGRETYQQLIHPLLSGIYGGDIETISLHATFPQFHAMEQAHGSVVKGLRAKQRTAPPALSASAFVTMRDGMHTLPLRVAERLGSEIVRTGQHVLCVERERASYRVVRANDAALTADAVLVTTPAFAAADVLRGMSPTLADELDGIPYTSTMIITLAYRADQVQRPLDGYGYLVPTSEGEAIRACTWSSSKIAGRAPDDHVLIRAFMGRHADEPCFQQSDDEIITTVTAALGRTLGLRGAPLHHRVTRWMRALPAYVMGHPERLGRIDAALENLPGLALAGTAYRGVGIPDCIADGERGASILWKDLRARALQSPLA
ncbi:MAG: protoporphyrinogen oxidase [Bacteroidota bacterium]